MLISDGISDVCSSDLFGTVSERFHTPANSVLFMGLLGAVLALTGSFLWLAIVSTLARLFVYGTSIAALPRAERQAGRRTVAGTFVLMGAGLLVCLWARSEERRGWKRCGSTGRT